MLDALLANPALSRAIVVGLFGGVGLACVTIYGRRGPHILPVYAALLAALALLLARYGALSYGARLAASLAGFMTASLLLYVAVGFKAKESRARLQREGRLPPGDLHGPSLFGHAWRLGFLVAAGTVVSAGVAFVAA